jgi:signal transduction histidine kinase/ActR/RegA family two-component response regulator
VLELAARAARAERGGVALISAHGEVVEHLTWGPGRAAAAEARRAGWGAELVEQLRREPGPVRQPRWPAGAGAPDGPFLGVAFDAPGRSRCVLYLGRAAGAAEFGADDVDAVLAVGTLLEQGSPIEEARMLARMGLLNQIAQAASGNLDLARIFRVALRELDRQVPLQRCGVWLAEDRAADPLSANGSVPELALPPECGPDAGPVLVLAEVAAGGPEPAAGAAPAAGLRLPLAETPFAGCFRDGQAFYADLDRPRAEGRGQKTEVRSQRAEGRREDGDGPGPYATPPEPSSPAWDLGARNATCCFAVPLRAGDRTLGVLQSVCLRPHGFTGEEIQLFYLVADLLGPAVSSCQLYARLRSAYEALRVTQGQLIQAEKMRALGELAGGMAHEFNNALCGTLGFLEVALLHPELPASAHGHLVSARTCALDAAQTVRRVQDFARRKRGDGPSEALDVNALVRQTVELIRHKWESLARARGAAVAVEVAAEASAAVAGNATELREVLTNLAFNAVDAMPGGGTLTLRTWSAGRWVYLAVGDTGVGIPESVRNRLFEPFFTTKGERGNGLGLSVVFGIVERHGGEITVDSEPGRGSTFTVRLPAAPAGATPARPSAAGLAPRAATAAGLRVLVVDDEASIRSFLDAALTRLGHRPALVADVPAALELFGRERFDLVLTDLGLPGASGEELARELRRRSPATPVVLLTGWADQLRAEGGSLEGVSRVLAKPVTLPTLAATLDELTDRPAARPTGG